MIEDIYFNYGNLVLILLFRGNWKKERKKEKKKNAILSPPLHFYVNKTATRLKYEKKKFYNQHCNVKLRINKNEKKIVNEKKKNNKTLIDYYIIVLFSKKWYPIMSYTFFLQNKNKKYGQRNSRPWKTPTENTKEKR